MTITEQLDKAYSEGKFAVIVTQYRIMPVRNRSMIRAAKGGVRVQSGKKWIFAFAYQVKFARDS
jgi:hypothetical protein